MTKETFETGATTHPINDLILFTDNTRELAEFRDSCYKLLLDRPTAESKITEPNTAKRIFMQLFDKARQAYYKEFKNYSNAHIKNITDVEAQEYCLLYAKDYGDWKKENGYNN